ncbi:hypothetical protein GCM10010198_01480 [Nocardia seriolae]|nr:hypothetical protein NSERKGN1266_23660 [Nocardia seriolae]BEK97579.1 hypothetical protein NSER024013_54850 [Nocardia seriolae]GEM26500.1 hypothetical protein NS2_47390 [Nocardia seriolae NBRC 15557]
MTPIRPTDFKFPTCAIPSTTVQNTIGAITILISLMNPSPNGFRSVPSHGHILPTTIPATTAISSCTNIDRYHGVRGPTATPPPSVSAMPAR